MKKLNSIDEIHPSFIIIACLIPIIFQSALFIFQVIHGILTIWNIISTGMVLVIFINGMRMELNTYKTHTQPNPVYETTGGTTIENKPKPQNNKKVSLILIIISIIFVLLSIFFLYQHQKYSKDLTLVNAEVVSQKGNTTIITTEDEDGITRTEKETIEVKIKYIFNGDEKTATLTSGTTSKIYVKTLQIYVDETGKCINDYGRVQIWQTEAIILLVLAIILTLSVIFSLGIIFIAGTISTGLGLSLSTLVGSTFIENFFFNDIICFLSMFTNVGLYFFTYGMMILILVGKNGLNNSSNNTIIKAQKRPRTPIK